jgi:hypothetical protein
MAQRWEIGMLRGMDRGDKTVTCRASVSLEEKAERPEVDA